MKGNNKNEIIATLNLLENNLEIAEHTINSAKKFQENLRELLKLEKYKKLDNN